MLVSLSMGSLFSFSYLQSISLASNFQGKLPVGKDKYWQEISANMRKFKKQS